MGQAIPTPSACDNTCTSPQQFSTTPGSDGAAGAAGAAGADGENGFTNLSAQFIMPAEGADVTIDVDSSAPFGLSQIIYIQSGGAVGYFQVIAKPGATQLTVRNIEDTAAGEYTDNSPPATVFAVSGLVTASGLQGPGGGAAAGALLSANNLNDVANAATSRSNLGLGTMAVQNSNSVSITGGAISGITDLPVADGGTGASNAAGARTNLGLVIGTNVQAQDATLQSIAALGTVADQIAYTTGVDTWAETPLSPAGRTLIAQSGTNGLRLSLGIQGIPLGMYLFRQEEANGVAGGDFTTGSWVTVPINTERVDTNNNASIAANEITIPGGTYRYRYGVVGYQVGTFQARLYNVTAAGVIANSYGSVAVSAAADGVVAVSQGSGRFTVVGSTTIRLEAQCSVTNAGDGFGLAGSFGVGEIYSWFEFTDELPV